MQIFMTIKDITTYLETWAPLSLQESYDNCGLLTGNPSDHCTGVLCTLDVTEAVIHEAVAKGCNMIVSHHPALFFSIKKLSSHNPAERIIILAIQHQIALYAIHTNLDNTPDGVNFALGQQLGFAKSDMRILQPKPTQLYHLYVYVPTNAAQSLQKALFAVGAGTIGQYTGCSFSSIGIGNFTPGENSNPSIGKAGGGEVQVAETKLEMVFPQHLLPVIENTIYSHHPYEQPAYGIVALQGANHNEGSGMFAHLPTPINETAWLASLKAGLGLQVIRHTAFKGKMIEKVGWCGGAGFFLLKKAIAMQVDAFITSDVKYHEFFEADGKILLADVGHFESEHCTIELLTTYLTSKFPTFAVLKSGVTTNPVYYFL